MKIAETSIFNMFALLSLQHFAEPINNVNHTGSEGLENQNKIFYSRQLIETMGPKLVHDQFAQKRDIPVNGGSSIEFRKWEALSTNLDELILYENIIPEGQELTTTDIIAVIGDAGGYVKLSDKLVLTAIDPVITQATKKISEQASIVADKITRERMMEGTNVIYANGGEFRHKLTPENTLKLVDIFKAAAQLKGANAPTLDGGAYVAIIHPYTSLELMLEDGVSNTWMDVSKYKNAEKIYNGELGKLGGVRFVETTQAKIIRGAKLGADSRTLTASAANGNKVTVAGAVENELVGRYVIISGELYYVSANTATQLTLVDPDDHVTAVTVTLGDDKTVYPGEGGAEGVSVFATIVIGADAYATTSIGGAGIEHIIHDKGEIGGPLNQYSTVGWKLRKTAEILVDEYMIRIESCSKTFPHAEAN